MTLQTFTAGSSPDAKIRENWAIERKGLYIELYSKKTLLESMEALLASQNLIERHHFDRDDKKRSGLIAVLINLKERIKEIEETLKTM